MSATELPEHARLRARLATMEEAMLECARRFDALLTRVAELEQRLVRVESQAHKHSLGRPKKDKP